MHNFNTTQVPIISGFLSSGRGIANTSVLEPDTWVMLEEE